MLQDTMYKLPIYAYEYLRSGNQIMLASSSGLCLGANEIIKANTINYAIHLESTTRFPVFFFNVIFGKCLLF